MVHLKSIKFTNAHITLEYPFSLSWFQKIESLELNSPVTIICGDNGCGKSTFMDLMAYSLGIYRINSSDVFDDSLMKEASKKLKPVYSSVKPLGFFFEAEAFITYLHYLIKEKAEASNELKRIEKEYANKSDYAKLMASIPHQKSIGELNQLYEYDITKRSHGEAYLDFFASRLKPKQLYLLDEPETPLSTQNQLTLLAMIKDAVQDDCQFIIATHSPIIMAYPNALLYEISDKGIQKIDYNDIESVNLLKQFLNAPEQFLKHL